MHKDYSTTELLAQDRTHLANERTLLAYGRTAFAFFGLGIFIIKFLESKYNIAFGVVSIIFGFGMFTFGYYRFRIEKKIINNR